MKSPVTNEYLQELRHALIEAEENGTRDEADTARSLYRQACATAYSVGNLVWDEPETVKPGTWCNVRFSLEFNGRNFVLNGTGFVTWAECLEDASDKAGRDLTPIEILHLAKRHVMTLAELEEFRQDMNNDY